MPDYSRPLAKLERTLRRSRDAAAVREARELVDSAPDDDALVSRVATLLLAAGHTADAVELLGERFDRRAAGDREAGKGAITLFRQLQPLQKQTGSRLLTFAKLLETSKQTEEAEKAYRHAAHAFRVAAAAEAELQAWRHVLRLNPRDYSTFLEVAARAEAAGQPNVAGEAYADAAGLAQEDPALLAKAFALLPARADIQVRYARALAATGQHVAVIALLEPLIQSPNAPSAAFEIYTDALLSEARPAEAQSTIEPRLALPGWFERGLRCLSLLAEARLDEEGATAVVAWAERLEGPSRQGDRNPLWTAALESVRASARQPVLLDFLVDAFGRAMVEPAQLRTLDQAVDLALSEGDYGRAGDLLTRRRDLDPEAALPPERIQALEGHLPDERLAPLRRRSMEESRTPTAPDVQPAADSVAAEDADQAEDASLDELILQAELFVQYHLEEKAADLVAGLARKFPGEEVHNPRLLQLYEATGVPVPRAPAGGSATIKSTAPAAPSSTEPEPHGVAQLAPIFRALHRESSPKRIFFTAVHQVGLLFEVDRCLAAKFNSGQPPSNVVEFCAPGIANSEPGVVARLLSLIEAQFQAHGSKPLALPRANESPAIQQTLEKLEVDTLLAQPLEEGGMVVGVIVLQSCRPGRTWTGNEIGIMGSLADQMLLALGNARLRALLRQFTAVDEHTGLLQVSSMLEVLVAECARAQEQRSNVAVLCLGLPRTVPLDSRQPDLGPWLDQLARKITSYLRANDAAARLQSDRFLLLLPDTIAANGTATLHKLRRALGDLAWPDGQPLYLAAGAAEIVVSLATAAGGEAVPLQPEDIATDVLDRSLRGLETASGEPSCPAVIVAPRV
ncbi:MAG: GAF domain-containing protein [Terriglobales bacterium]